jgi:hypothetical protein
MALIHADAAGSAIADDPAATIKHSWWDKNHQFTGGTNGDLLTRDTSGANGGMAWIASVALGRVLASGGAGQPPAWTTAPPLEGVVFPLTDPAAPVNGQVWCIATGSVGSGTFTIRARVAGVTINVISVPF